MGQFQNDEQSPQQQLPSGYVALGSHYPILAIAYPVLKQEAACGKVLCQLRHLSFKKTADSGTRGILTCFNRVPRAECRHIKVWTKGDSKGKRRKGEKRRRKQRLCSRKGGRSSSYGKLCFPLL